MPKDDMPTPATPTGTERKRLGLPGERGIEIPVPTRQQVFENLVRDAKPDGPDDNEDFLDR